MHEGKKDNLHRMVFNGYRRLGKGEAKWRQRIQEELKGHRTDGEKELVEALEEISGVVVKVAKAADPEKGQGKGQDKKMKISEKKIIGKILKQILPHAQPYGMGWMTELNFEFTDDEKRVMEKLHDNTQR